MCRTILACGAKVSFLCESYIVWLGRSSNSSISTSRYGFIFLGSFGPGIIPTRNNEVDLVRMSLGRFRRLSVTGHMLYDVFSLENGFIPSVHKANAKDLASPWNAPFSEHSVFHAFERWISSMIDCSEVADICCWISLDSLGMENILLIQGRIGRYLNFLTGWLVPL